MEFLIELICKFKALKQMHDDDYADYLSDLHIEPGLGLSCELNPGRCYLGLGLE